jgi:hypothetical protein
MKFYYIKHVPTIFLMVFFRPIEERFSIHQAMILNIHVSLCHISIQWISKKFIMWLVKFAKKKTKTSKFNGALMCFIVLQTTKHKHCACCSSRSQRELEKFIIIIIIIIIMWLTCSLFHTSWTHENLITCWHCHKIRLGKFAYRTHISIILGF